MAIVKHTISEMDEDEKRYHKKEAQLLMSRQESNIIQNERRTNFGILQMQTLRQVLVLLAVSLSVILTIVLTMPISAHAEESSPTSELKYYNANGLMQLKINDSDGYLVGYIETTKIRILKHDTMDDFFDTWEQRHEVIINGIAYTVFELDGGKSVIPVKFWTGRTGLTLSNLGVDSVGYMHDLVAIYGIHPQFLLEEGDVLKINLSVILPQ